MSSAPMFIGLEFHDGRRTVIKTESYVVAFLQGIVNHGDHYEVELRDVPGLGMSYVAMTEKPKIPFPIKSLFMPVTDNIIGSEEARDRASGTYKEKGPSLADVLNQLGVQVEEAPEPKRSIN